MGENEYSKNIKKFLKEWGTGNLDITEKK